MNKAKFILGTLMSMATMYSCTPKAAKVAKAPENEFKAFAQKFTNQELAEGKTLMEASCARCHKLKDPMKHNVDKWDKILDRMIPKAKVSKEEGDKIRAYIFSIASVEG